MGRIDQAGLPQRRRVHSGVVVRIEGVNAVVLRGHVHYIVRAQAGDVHVGDVQRLGINIAVHRLRKQLAELTYVDVARGENRLAQVLPIAHVVVARSGYANLGRGR